MKVREEGILLTELDNVFIIQRIDSEAQVYFRKAGVGHFLLYSSPRYTFISVRICVVYRRIRRILRAP